jgi:predicted DNA-binding transcriptional regulator YafY
MAYKHDYDKALTRLVSILTKLYNGESLSVKDLAMEFNVSARTIQRDFNERLISFPIYQENRLWKMQDGFKLEKMSSIEDNIILNIMEKLIEGIGDKFSSRAKVLLSKIKNQDYNPIYAKLDLEDISDKLNVIQQLEGAIKLKQVVKCKYQLDNKKTYEIKIKPLKIVNFEGFWYLIALDVNNKDALKKYYLKNIYNLHILNDRFEVNTSLEELLTNSISIWFQEKNKPFEIKIHVSNVVSKYVNRKPIAPTQIIESIYEDDSLDIIVKVTHEMEIIPLVKYWLPHMKVIEPKWIDEIICNDLKKYLKSLK